MTAPPGARRDTSTLIQLAEHVGALLDGAGPEAAQAALEIVQAGGGPVGETQRLELIDRVARRLRGLLANHDWWLEGPRRQRMFLGVLAPWFAERPRGGGSFLELGAPPATSLSLSALMYANGMDRTLAVSETAPTDPARAARAIHDLALACLAHPAEMRAARLPDWQFADRIRSFDLERLANGDLAGAAPCKLAVADLETAWRDAGSAPFDLVASFSHLNEVDDLPRLATLLARIVPPGGRMVHLVDFRDYHGASPWAHLSDPAATRPRFSALVEALEAPGFRLLQADRTDEEPPAAVWRALAPRYRDLPARDITTQQATLYLARVR